LGDLGGMGVACGEHVCKRSLFFLRIPILEIALPPGFKESD
jgi:hypothetical protein